MRNHRVNISVRPSWLTLLLATTLTSVALTAVAALPASMGGKSLPSLAPMLEKVTPAVVNISTEGRVLVKEGSLFNDPIFRHFFDLPEVVKEKKTHSLGSGVVVDSRKGYILTNHHVIEDADEIRVTLHDGRRLVGTLVGADPETDIALIQVQARGLTALPLGDSDQLRVGDFVVAIGNPFALGQTVTSGIVSALGRSGLGIEGYEDFIQTDASINVGNSGGALVNLRGELVGVNTAILAPNGGNIGIGFAIPVRLAQQVMRQIVAYGEVRRGRLGVATQDLTPALANAFGITAQGGAVIAKVSPRSPAAKAGLRAGDIVTAINGRIVRNSDALRNAIGLLPIGESVTLDILRAGQQRQVRLRITQPVRSRVAGDKLDPRLEGAVLGDIEGGSPLSQRTQGVVVHDVTRGSPIFHAGLREDDLIVAVNRHRVRNLQELEELLEQIQGRLVFNVERGEGALYLPVY
jgi:Do/DeqQ family serine protease